MVWVEGVIVFPDLLTPMIKKHIQFSMSWNTCRGLVSTGDCTPCMQRFWIAVVGHLKGKQDPAAPERVQKREQPSLLHLQQWVFCLLEGLWRPWPRWRVWIFQHRHCQAAWSELTESIPAHWARSSALSATLVFECISAFPEVPQLSHHCHHSGAVHTYMYTLCGRCLPSVPFSRVLYLDWDSGMPQCAIKSDSLASHVFCFCFVLLPIKMLRCTDIVNVLLYFNNRASFYLWTQLLSLPRQTRVTAGVTLETKNEMA